MKTIRSWWFLIVNFVFVIVLKSRINLFLKLVTVRSASDLLVCIMSVDSFIFYLLFICDLLWLVECVAGYFPVICLIFGSFSVVHQWINWMEKKVKVTCWWIWSLKTNRGRDNSPGGLSEDYYPSRFSLCEKFLFRFPPLAPSFFTFFLSFPGFIFPFFFPLADCLWFWFSLPPLAPLTPRPLHSLSASSPSVCCRGWAKLLHAASLITSQDSHIWDGLQAFPNGPAHTHTLRHT